MFSRSFRASKTFTTFVVSFAVFTDILIQNLVVPVLPYALHTRIGIDDQDSIQRWTSILLAAYGAMLMVGCLFLGYITDRFRSRRTIFLLGLVLLFLSTLFFSLATTVWALLVARIFQGLSAAIVHTTGLTLLAEVVGKDHLGKAMGYESMALSIGLLIGPVLGGVLYEYCGYFHVFTPAYALIIIDILLRCMLVEEKKKVPNPVIPSSPSAPETTEGATTSDHAAEQHASSDEFEPLLRHPPKSTDRQRNAYKTLLTTPQFMAALISLLILESIANGFDSTLVPFVQDAFNMPASRSAVLFLALAVPMFLAPLSGWLADRFGPRLPILLGIASAVPSLGFLSMISSATAMPLPKMMATLVFVGLALALAIGPLSVAAIAAVHLIEERSSPGEFGANGILARSIGLMNTVVAAGGLLGPLYAGFVRVAGGWKVLELSNAVLCICIFVLALLSTGGKKVDERQGAV
ncbi:MAG: hypothetical protein L6R36_005932 [Xanthoria steineri]|nr:MAG: hypothetical protein L6R36_005932 [Xanthoria steineri]